MTQPCIYPASNDAVLGDRASVTSGHAVLGGIEGLEQRLNQGSRDQRLTALKAALTYGEPGLELVLKSLYHDFLDVRIAAYTLLRHQPDPNIQKQLQARLPRFSYDVVTLDNKGRKVLRQRRRKRFFPEYLPNQAMLELVPVPSGQFWMGAADKEKGQCGHEFPRHLVKIQPFWMSKYPITQAQWQAVSELPTVQRSLSPNPFYFPGGDRPIEQVSWYDATEFCARLSAYTNCTYRLPTEAEWEYACRAGTQTPFEFGETICTTLANYYGNSFPYRSEPKGVFRCATTQVGKLGFANGFGLYDMHGNVLEWCIDHWHPDYKGAPNDGQAWLSSGRKPRVLRGGAWCLYPESCRSAYRNHAEPSYTSSSVGFRVVCESPCAGAMEDSCWPTVVHVPEKPKSSFTTKLKKLLPFET